MRKNIAYILTAMFIITFLTSVGLAARPTASFPELNCVNETVSYAAQQSSSTNVSTAFTWLVQINITNNNTIGGITCNGTITTFFTSAVDTSYILGLNQSINNTITKVNSNTSDANNRWVINFSSHLIPSNSSVAYNLTLRMNSSITSQVLESQQRGNQRIASICNYHEDPIINIQSNEAGYFDWDDGSLRIYDCGTDSKCGSTFGTDGTTGKTNLTSVTRTGSGNTHQATWQDANMSIVATTNGVCVKNYYAIEGATNMTGSGVYEYPDSSSGVSPQPYPVEQVPQGQYGDQSFEGTVQQTQNQMNGFLNASTFGVPNIMILVVSVIVGIVAILLFVKR